uniref:Uncharacterized protein n=1 Tax=uncultured organism MedDCM-OCT-S09-C568 TaxID=743651 RepID=D6PJE8_9ZZZZ|nr:hypothetical protein [uncultured organism MedDCM-OCT-S09-C568]ADD95850.1 hypothetical protein [uncultured organism MedDCM-OCT-S09-C568]
MPETGIVRTQLDVVHARERSAKVSLFLVDLPFGTLRMFFWAVIYMGHKNEQPLWPPLAMKNLTCFFLQFMQLRILPIVSV